MPMPLVTWLSAATVTAAVVTPPPAATWTKYSGRWCNEGRLVADLGKGVTLAACEEACLADVHLGCGFVSHADQTDGRCMLYEDCPNPMCGKDDGWFTTYQYTTPGKPAPAPFAPCKPPGPPGPPGPPTGPQMVTHIVSDATTASHGAKCLDGTPPAYLLRTGTGANASKFVIFLEGGGWCFGVDDCARRRGGGLGSSSGYKEGQGKHDYGGVMSFSSTVNPDFHTWSMVFVHYCDGSSFSSYRPDPVATKKGLMWFRGKANLAAVLDELKSDHGLDAATEVILSGGSAGGLAVYYHLDYFAEVVHASAPAARISGFPDAGYFADLKNTAGQYEYRGFYQTADATAWNSTASVGTNAACLAAHPTNATSWKCLMAEYLTDYIITPMFVMNAAFDVYQVQNILDVGCVPTKCSAAQIESMEGYRRDYINSSIAHLVARAAAGFGHGAYIDSCLVHEQNVDYCSGGSPHAYNCVGWLNTKVLGVTPQQAFSAWYQGSTRNFTIDPAAYIAPAPPGGSANPTCPWTFPTVRA